MKLRSEKLIAILVLLVCLSMATHAQVTIGADKEPIQGALLDLKSDNASADGGATTGTADGTGGGLLLPRVNLVDINKLSPFVKDSDPNLASLKLKLTGLMVYNLTVGQGGFTAAGTYTWDGIQWDLTTTPRIGGEVEFWSIEGNPATDPTTNFLGTTDNQPLVFKVNNLRAGYIGNSTSANYNAIGMNALMNNTGSNNNAFGNSALGSNTTGTNNTAVGNSAASTLTTGSNNIAIGNNAQLPSLTDNNQISIANLIYATGATGINTAGNVGIGNNAPAAKLDVAGNVKIADGTQGLGKILTSDANGLASWQDSGNPKWFYMPSFNLDVSTTGSKTIDLYSEYENQFKKDGSSDTQFVSSNATLTQVQQKVYNRDELDYIVTAYFPSDINVFKINSIDENGIMSYEVVSTNIPENSFINIVLLVK